MHWRLSQPSVKRRLPQVWSSSYSSCNDMTSKTDSVSLNGLRRAKPRAIICDIDDTICTEFDRPIAIACEVLHRIGRAIQVHYVTSRPEESRDGTLTFMDDNRL